VGVLVLWAFVSFSCAIATAAFANRSNRCWPGWFIGGLLLGPIGILTILTLPTHGEKEAEHEAWPYVPSTPKQRIIPRVFVALTVLYMIYVAFLVLMACCFK